MKLPINVPYEVRSLVSHDGTEIVYLVAGTGTTPVVMCPGLGGPMISYKYLFERLGDRYRFLTWEPRGLYRSGVPAGGSAALSLEHHVGDLERLVAAEKFDRFVLGGWSMGVQVSLEYAHRHPEHCLALVLLNGCYGSVLNTLAGIEGAAPLFAQLVRGVGLAGPVLNRLARLLLDHPALIKLLHRMKFVAANPEFFRRVVGEFKQLDFRRYMQMVLALHAHTAEPYLDRLDIPALVVIATHDLLAPRKVGENLSARLPNARKAIVEGGTHYALLEYPEVVNAEVESFLEATLRHADGPAAKATSPSR